MQSPSSTSAPKPIASLAAVGPNFYSFGDVGGDTFFGTLSPAAQARRLATQARANASSKQVSAHKQLHRTLMKLIHSQPSYAPVRTRQGSAPATPGARAEPGSGAAPQLARTSLQRTLASLRQGGSRSLGAAPLTRLARAISASAGGLPPGFYQQIRTNRALRGTGSGIGIAATLAAASRLRPAFSAFARHRSSLPSIAPLGFATTHSAGAASQTHGASSSTSFGSLSDETSEALTLAGRQTRNAANPGPSEDFAADTETRQQQVQHAFTEFLDRQARLPPSGATGFDPRLTPAWSGVKLPS